MKEMLENIEQTRTVWHMQLDHQRNRVLRINLLIRWGGGGGGGVCWVLGVGGAGGIGGPPPGCSALHQQRGQATTSPPPVPIPLPPPQHAEPGRRHGNAAGCILRHES